jgi:alpha-mannosidase
MYKLLRRGSGRLFILCAILLSLLLCLYYVSQNPGPNSSDPGVSELIADVEIIASTEPEYSKLMNAQVLHGMCPLIKPRKVDIDAQFEFENFDFQVKITNG